MLVALNTMNEAAKVMQPNVMTLAAEIDHTAFRIQKGEGWIFNICRPRPDQSSICVQVEWRGR